MNLVLKLTPKKGGDHYYKARIGKNFDICQILNYLRKAYGKRKTRLIDFLGQFFFSKIVLVYFLNDIFLFFDVDKLMV